jgi:hypothetical protein
MKFFFVLFILLSRFSLASESHLFDLMYLPKSGTLYGSTDALYLWGESTRHDDQYGNVDFGFNGYGVKQSLGFSLLDNLFLSASLGALLADTKSEFKNGASLTNRSAGLSDPVVQARIRLISDQYLLDLIAGGQISTGKSKIATEETDGNIKTGGHIGKLAFEIGRKHMDFQFSAQLGYSYIYEAKSDLDGMTIKSNPHSAYNIRGSFQYAISSDSHINPFAELIFTNAFNDNSGSRTSQRSQIDLGTDFKHLINQDFMLKLGVKYTNFEINIYDNLETTEDILLTFIAGANYQF